MLALNKDFLRGSYPPLVTPFRAGAVDYDAYARMVERQVAESSHGIVINGTTAEPSTLSLAERNELVRLAVATARGRIPVVAATGSQSHADTVELTAAAEKAGADAVLIVTPYFIRPPQRGLVEYYSDLGRRTRLPLMISHPRTRGGKRRGRHYRAHRRAYTQPGRDEARGQRPRAGDAGARADGQ